MGKKVLHSLRSTDRTLHSGVVKFTDSVQPRQAGRTTPVTSTLESAVLKAASKAHRSARQTIPPEAAPWTLLDIPGPQHVPNRRKSR